jgi:hypothetical protein
MGILTAAGLRLVSRRDLDRAPWQQIVLTPVPSADGAHERNELLT